MPIYEYICEKCKLEFEALVRGDEQPECPKCGDADLQKQMSVTSAHSASGANPPGCPTECSPARAPM